MTSMASADIDRPVEAVWAFIVDPANNPKWDAGTLEAHHVVFPEKANRSLNTRLRCMLPNQA